MNALKCTDEYSFSTDEYIFTAIISTPFQKKSCFILGKPDINLKLTFKSAVLLVDDEFVKLRHVIDVGVIAGRDTRLGGCGWSNIQHQQTLPV